MTDDLTQQVAQTAGTSGLGGVIGAIVAFLGSLNLFAKKSEVDIAVNNVQLQSLSALNAYKAEAAEKYITRNVLRETMKPLEDHILHIRDRIDVLTDTTQRKNQ